MSMGEWHNITTVLFGSHVHSEHISCMYLHKTGNKEKGLEHILISLVDIHHHNVKTGSAKRDRRNVYRNIKRINICTYQRW